MNKIIIVDTMVWTYLFDKDYYFDDAEEIVKKFLRQGFRVAITSVIEHEFLRGRVERYQNYFKKVVEWANKIEVNNDTFMKAVDVFKVQQMMYDKFEKNPGKYLGDILIAASAFLEECYILTANLKDFSAPLFTIRSSEVLMKKGKGEFKNRLSRIETIYLLEPNYEFIDRVLPRLDKNTIDDKRF